MVLDAAVDDLGVALAAGAGDTALDRLDGPVVATALGVGVSARGAALPLLVERRLAAATAEDVGAPVAGTLRGGSLRHCNTLQRRQISSFHTQMSSLRCAHTG